MQKLAENKWRVAGTVAAGALLLFGASRLVSFLRHRYRRMFEFSMSCLTIRKEVERHRKDEASTVQPLYELISQKTTAGDFVFQLLSRQPWKQKPQTFVTNDVFMPPFGNGIYIMDLQPSHRLVFNKFMVVQNHLLVITKLPEPQFSELNEADFLSGFLTLAAVDGLCFYNSDITAGSSQRHKHLQVMPLAAFRTPLLDKLRAAAAAAAPVQWAVEEPSVLRCPHFDGLKVLCVALRRFRSSESPKEHAQYLARVYHLCKARLGADNSEQSFNLAFGHDWMLLGLRRAERAFGVSMNAMVLLGSLLFKDAADLDKFKAMPPKEFLAEILVAQNDNALYAFNKNY